MSKSKELIIRVDDKGISLEGKQTDRDGTHEPLTDDELLGIVVYAKHWLMNRLFAVKTEQ